jgi:hypothetical protein
MKEQLSYLRNFMKQAVALSFPNSLPSLPPDSVVPPDVPPPAIPDLFPDDTIGDSKSIKSEPNLGSNSLVPDITNSTISHVPTINPAFILTPVVPVTINPSITHDVMPTITSPPIIPDVISPAAINPTTNVMDETFLNTPSTSLSSTPLVTPNSTFASSPSPNLGTSASFAGSNSLSSIFNNILGTDLNFSGILVKTEPSFDSSQLP